MSPPPHKFLQSSAVSSTSAPMISGLALGNINHSNTLSLERSKEQIKKLFSKIELSVSSYDTAWVAMIASPISPRDPFFPQCVNWLLENQLPDGSWGLPDCHPLLKKDALLSTLLCILVLKQWGIGEEQMNKGLRFMESNFSIVSDEKQYSPIGFDIIFPSLIERSQNLELNLHIEATKIEALFRKRGAQITRGHQCNSEGWRAYRAYIAEGVESQDWEMVMKFQRKNGSLFNSPATTAAAFTHLQDAGCLNYLRSLLQQFGNAVPTIYPLETYARLCMVDSLQMLGVNCHFKKEIGSALDDIYRGWQQEDEDIVLNPTTCAMAFRILRDNGYEVSSDPLHQYFEDKFSNSLEGYLKDVQAVLELYKASEIIIHPNESALESQNSWTRHFLTKELSPHMIYSIDLHRHMGKISDTLKFPYHGSLERVSNRRAIENYDIDNTRILKTAYSSANLANIDFLKLAVEDFNACQSIHLEEYKLLTRWYAECKFDELKFARQKLAYCYFTPAATLFSPELSDARIAWAKNGVLTTLVDDFFDVGASKEEMINLIDLMEKWDVDSADFCSEPVEIIFSAVKGTISEIVEKAFNLQGCSVKTHVTEIWLDLLRSMMREAEWSKTKAVPTLDEYMENAYLSFALGPIVLPALYLVGPKLSREAVESVEYHSLFELMSICGRLLNDINSDKREVETGKLNAIALRLMQSNGALTEEQVIKEFKGLISSKRNELLRSVLREKDSVIPKKCKDVFWKMTKVLHLFYAKDDGFTSHELIGIANAVIKEPIVLSDHLRDALQHVGPIKE